MDNEDDIAKQQLGSKRRRWGVVLSYANAFVSIVVGLLYVPLLLQGIGQDEFGLYQLVGSLIGYVTILSGVLSAGTTRFYCTAHAEGDEAGMRRVLATCRAMFRKISLIVVVIAAAAIVAFPVVYANSLSAGQIAECQLMLALLVVDLIVTMFNSVYVAAINANERFVFLRGTTLLNAVIQPLAVVTIIFFVPYAVSVVLATLVINIVIAFAQNRFARCKLEARIVASENDPRLQRVITAFMLGLLIASVADQIFWRTNQLMLGYYFGAGVVAVYGVGAQIYNCYLYLGTVITSVFLPRVSELCAARRIDLVSDLFIKVGRLSLYVLLGILGGFIAFGQSFIELWAGSGYEDAYWVALFVMTAFMVDSSQSLGLTTLQVLDKYRFRARMYFALSLVDVLLVIVLCPYIGGVGCAALSSAVMLVGNGLIMNVYYHRVIGLDIGGFWKNALSIMVPAAVLTAFAGWAWAVLPIGRGWLELLAACIVFGMAFFAVSWVVCFNGYEKDLVKGIVGKILPRQMLR